MQWVSTLFRGQSWARGDLSMDSRDDDAGSVRVFYLRYYGYYFEDFDSTEDAQRFVRFLRTYFPDDDDGQERTAGIFEAAINKETNEDITSVFQDIEGADW